MRSTLVRSVSLLAVVGFLAACDGDIGPTGPAGPAGAAGADGATGPAGAQGDPGIENFTAPLNEANVVGGTGSTATGTASFSVVDQTLVYNIDITGITDVTATHIHGPAAVGAPPPSPCWRRRRKPSHSAGFSSPKATPSYSTRPRRW